MQVVFTPYSHHGIGIVYPENATHNATFKNIDISFATTQSRKYHNEGSAVIGTKIYYAPHRAKSIGIFDTVTEVLPDCQP